MQRLWDFLRFVVFFYLTGFLIFVFKKFGIVFSFFLFVSTLLKLKKLVYSDFVVCELFSAPKKRVLIYWPVI